MTTTDQAPASSNQSTGNEPKTRWFSPRRKRFWIVLVLVLYALLGIFAAPKIIRNQLTALLQDDLGRPTSIERIAVNPFYLSLRVQGFELEDTDGIKLAAFDELYINFQFLSLLKWAWTFSEIQLTGPYFHFERFDSDDTRLTRLLDDFAKAYPAEPGTGDDAPGDVPRVLIRNLDLNDGHVDFRDNLPETPVEMQLLPINISIQELNTLPDLHGQQSVAIHLPNDAKLEWNGSLSLAPLDSRGELVLEDLHLQPLISYLEGLLPLESIEARLSSHFRYHVSQDVSSAIELDIDELDISLVDLLVSGLTPVTEFIDVQAISLLDGKLRYPEQSLHFGELNITNPQLSAWLNEDGSLSIMDLVPETPGTAETEAGDASLPWHLGIGEFSLDGGQVSLSDRSIQPNADIGLTQLRARISGINNEADVLMPFEISGSLAGGGNYTFNGKLGMLPEFSMSANATTDAIPLSLGQPYVQQLAHIAIESGVLNSVLKLNMSTDQNLSLGGSLQVPGLEVSDTLNSKKLLGWAMLDIDRFDLDSDALQISQLSLEQPHGRFVVHEDMSTNVAGIMKPGTDEAPSEADKDSMDIVIGGVRVDQGTMDFADFSLPLPFATYITGLDGNITTIATTSVEPANIRLEGQVDEYGLARIDGSMDMLDPIRHTDVTLEFRNLLMSALSPYTVQFAGRRIDQGKLDLGLVYSIEEGQLHGQNDVVLSELELGDKVDHPDAASLPLGLAVSLLKDADGVITIDLPVEGDINDPEFKIGGIIWQAFTGIITKIVSAPFKLLGNLIGIDSEDFGQFEFLAGRADLTPPELEKVVQLQQALQKRPELIIEVSGVTDRVVDVPALKFIRLRDIANERLEQDLGNQLDDTAMLDEEMRRVVESMFTERFPDIPSASLQAAHTAPPAEDPDGKPVLDELAWAMDMWKRMLTAEVISEQDLADLANTRAKVIQTAFLASGEIDETRIVIAEPKEVESDDGEWVMLELGVASG